MFSMYFLFHDALNKLVKVDGIAALLICYMHFTLYKKMLRKIIASFCAALTGVHYDTSKI